MIRTILGRLQSLPPLYSISLIALIVVIAVTVVGSRGTLTSLVASSASSLNGKDAVLFFSSPEVESFAVGETMDIGVRINTRTPINAIGVTIHVPPDTLEIIGLSKEKSLLDLWTEETIIDEKKGELHFSGGTLQKGGHSGIGELLTISVRARAEGRAELRFITTDVFAHNGEGKAIPNDVRTLALQIVHKEVSKAGTTGAYSPEVSASTPSSDINNDGHTTLVDISMFALQLLATYNARYDLNADGMVNLRDLSIIFAQLGR